MDAKEMKETNKVNEAEEAKPELKTEAKPETKAVGEKLIGKEISSLENENVKQQVSDYMDKIENGERDFRF